MIKTGDKAPQFTLPDQTGKPVTFGDRIQQNAPLLLVFYKNNCPTCQFTFPHLARIASKLGPEHFLAIAQDSTADANVFKKKYGFSFDVLSDSHPYPVSVQYGLEFVPTFFVIEADQRISQIAEGFDKKAIDDFAKRISQLKKISNFFAFDPSDQVPLLKPG